MSDDDSKYPSELAERFQVRLPLGMRDRIKSAAEANNRSMNAEIVATLEEKYPAPDIKAEDLLAEYITISNALRTIPISEDERAAVYKRMDEINDIYKRLTGNSNIFS